VASQVAKAVRRGRQRLPRLPRTSSADACRQEMADGRHGLASGAGSFGRMIPGGLCGRGGGGMGLPMRLIPAASTQARRLRGRLP